MRAPRARETAWRVHRVGWYRFTHDRRRQLITIEALALAGAAVAVPLYLHVAGYQWRTGAGDHVRELPPNIDRVLSWALWTAEIGAAFAAAVVIGLVATHLTGQLRMPPAQWRRVPAAAIWALIVGALWAVSSMTTTGVIVNGLVMT